MNYSQKIEEVNRATDHLITTMLGEIEILSGRVETLESQLKLERKRGAGMIKTFGLTTWEENEASRKLGEMLREHPDLLDLFMTAANVDHILRADSFEAVLTLMNALCIPYEDACVVVDQLQGS